MDASSLSSAEDSTIETASSSQDEVHHGMDKTDTKSKGKRGFAFLL